MSGLEKQIDKAIINRLTKAINELVGDCMDENGNPKLPSKSTLNKARAMLPPNQSNSFAKGVKNVA